MLLMWEVSGHSSASHLKCAVLHLKQSVNQSRALVGHWFNFLLTSQHTEQQDSVNNSYKNIDLLISPSCESKSLTRLSITHSSWYLSFTEPCFYVYLTDRLTNLCTLIFPVTPPSGQNLTLYILCLVSKVFPLKHNI